MAMHRPTFWKVALTATISFALTFSLFQYKESKSNSDSKKEIAQLATVFTSADSVVRQVRVLKQKIYWLGPLGDSTFTVSKDDDGVQAIIYWPAGTSSMNFNIPRRVIRTYPNLTNYANSYHPLNLPQDVRTFNFPYGKMQYGINSMDYQTFFLPNDSVIVEIHYAEPHTEAELLANADLLSQIG